MVLPALIPAIASLVGWIGIDLGISWLTRDEADVQYVSGLDFSTFLEYYWLQLLLYGLMIASAAIIAIPKPKHMKARGPGPRYRPGTNELKTCSTNISSSSRPPSWRSSQVAS